MTPNYVAQNNAIQTQTRPVSFTWGRAVVVCLGGAPMLLTTDRANE